MSVDAVGTPDLPVIMGVTMFGAFFVVVANIVVDVLYTVVDPGDATEVAISVV